MYSNNERRKIYLLAAERIFSNRDDFSCIAIKMIVFDTLNTKHWEVGYTHLIQNFPELVLFDVCNKERVFDSKEQRIFALLLSAEMTK